MKLSIIIPVYNTEKYLEECVLSLFEQHIPQEDFEIILINDGSVDASLDVCKKLSQQYKNIKVFDQENQGQSVARNVGINHAQGKYIYFIDSDDYLKSGYLNTFLNIIEQENLDFLGFATYNTTQRYIPTGSPDTLELLVKGNGLEIIGKHTFHNGSCWFIFSKETAKNLYFEAGRLCEDVIFTTLLLLRVKKGHIYKNEVYNYNKSTVSTLRSNDLARIYKVNNDMFYAAEKFSEIIDSTNFDSYPDSFTNLKKKQESYTYFAIIRFIKSRRKFSELNKYLSVLERCNHQGYPISNFKGYNKRDKLLINCFNNKTLLFVILQLNKSLKVIK
ncbi:MAG: glycosyltransferase [Capnocytophaga sp.]|nr:glycosyltransferase [Capnocytophaga sp.]